MRLRYIAQHSRNTVAVGDKRRSGALAFDTAYLSARLC
jgi:hypothetical protein